jgi:predicted nucleic acid-binding protein
VEHDGNQSESPEEVEAVAQLVDELLSAGLEWTHRSEGTRPLRAQDILVVANGAVSGLGRSGGTDIARDKDELIADAIKFPPPAVAGSSLSLVDRTCFAVMQRLAVHRVASFDAHFAVYRFGPDRRQAFEVLR